MTAADIADSYAAVADRLARWRRLDRLFAGRFRRRQFGNADGRVLDVACGTGRNFAHLPQTVDLVGIDISPEMLGHARDELTRLDLDGTVSQMDAQALDFAPDSFDTVISSFATCTFPDRRAALEEMRRVCKPDGQIRLLEHSRSDVDPIARLQDWRAGVHYEKTGCRLAHEPLHAVRETDLVIENVRTQFFGLVTAIDATPPDRRTGRSVQSLTHDSPSHNGTRTNRPDED